MSDVIAFDLDGSGDFGALTDALMLIRHDFGFRGQALISGAVDEAACARCSAAEIEAFVAELGSAIDVDGNGQVDALTDGIAALRWAFGLRGASLATGAVGAGLHSMHRRGDRGLSRVLGGLIDGGPPPLSSSRRIFR